MGMITYYTVEVYDDDLDRHWEAGEGDTPEQALQEAVEWIIKNKDEDDFGLQPYVSLDITLSLQKKVYPDEGSEHD